jgi:hypothetical protein
MKIKVARPESKETIHLILTYEEQQLKKERLELIDEAVQIKRILSAILKKLE